MILTALAFIFVFGVLVFVHELGHFLAAKFTGVMVKEFAFGFPPKIFSKKVGETVYALNALPIGGYVKLMGEEGEDKKNPKSLAHKSPGQKILIFVAGVFMNFFLAWFLLTIFYAVGAKAIIPGMWEHAGVTNTQKVQIKEVTKGSPAEKEGLLSGDTILQVNGQTVYWPQEVFGLIQDAKSKSDEQIAIKLLRNDRMLERKIDTYKDVVDGVEYQRVGILMDSTGEVKSSWYLAPIVAAKETARLTKMTLVEFGKFVSLAVTKGKISENVGGPVAIVSLTGTAARLGFAALVQFMIILSVSLAILNILPFPALDGGHVAITGIEALIGKEIPEKTKQTINKVGFGLLLLLVILITARDVSRFEIFSKIFR